MSRLLLSTQRSNGDPIHLRHRQLLHSNDWGLRGSSSSSSWDRKVKRKYRKALLCDAQGRQMHQGVLLVDICNPRVNVHGNTRQRARRLARRFRHAVFLVVSGKGVTRILWDEQQGQVVTERYVAYFLKRAAAGQMGSLQVNGAAMLA